LRGPLLGLRRGGGEVFFGTFASDDKGVALGRSRATVPGVFQHLEMNFKDAQIQRSAASFRQLQFSS
jgi:hypothetical protein